MCTIIAKNYLAFARTLVKSFLQHHPTGKAYVLLADESEGLVNAHEEIFEWIHLKDIGLPESLEMSFQYDVTEFNTAVKPYFLDYLLRARGVETVIYFDPDILITQRMDGFFRALPQHSIVLTPHTLSDIPKDGHKPNEIDILQAGVYNLGFLALSRTEETLRMLDWWKTKLRNECIMDPAGGYHVDQRWMDLVPARFDGVHILKDPTFNVSYWNLHERPVVNRNGLYEIHGKPLTFYHFSGLVSDLSRISKHQTRFQWGQFPDLKKLFGEYVAQLTANGYPATAGWRYAYHYFDNGISVPPIARTIYRKLESKQAFGNPFLTLTPNGFYQWLFSPTSLVSPVPQILKEIYYARIDLQRVFPDFYGADRNNLMNWAREHVPLEYGVDPLVWNPVWSSMIFR